MAGSHDAGKASAAIHFPTIGGARQQRPPFLFGAVIREYRKKQGLSQQELAEKMQVTRNTVVNWETDKSKPDFEAIPRLCSLLSISYEMFFGVSFGAGLDQPEQRLIAAYRQLSPVGKKVGMSMVLTMLDEECKAMEESYLASYIILAREPGAAAAGSGFEYTDEKPAPVFLRKTDVSVRADAIVRVSGSSMEPVYREGDYVYIRYADSAYSGEDVVCATANGLVIKRMDDNGRLYSVNKAQPFGKKYEDDHIEIKGKVLGIVSPADQAPDADLSLLNELFREQLREFNRAHGLNDAD